MARKYVLTVETKISPSLTLRRARDAALSKIRETTSGTFHCDLSRDMSDGARFSRMDNDATAVRMGDAQVRSPALEGKPIDLNNDFSGTESKPETVPGLKALAPSVEAEVVKYGLAGKETPRVVRRPFGNGTDRPKDHSKRSLAGLEKAGIVKFNACALLQHHLSQ